jgi:hypothetical protein
MYFSLRAECAARLVLFAVVVLVLIGLPTPVTAADSELSSSVGTAPAPAFVVLASSWFGNSYNRTTVIRIAVVVMVVGLFILLRK